MATRSPRGRWYREQCARMYATTGATWCTYCGRTTSRDLPANHALKATCDHVVPVNRGGGDDRRNRSAHAW